MGQKSTSWDLLQVRKLLEICCAAEDTAVRRRWRGQRTVFDRHHEHIQRLDLKQIEARFQFFLRLGVGIPASAQSDGGEGGMRQRRTLRSLSLSLFLSLPTK